MADNYLENRYEDYLARKLKKDADRKRDFRRRLEAYRKSLESAPNPLRERCSENQ